MSVWYITLESRGYLLINTLMVNITACLDLIFLDLQCKRNDNVSHQTESMIRHREWIQAKETSAALLRLTLVHHSAVMLHVLPLATVISHMRRLSSHGCSCSLRCYFWSISWCLRAWSTLVLVWPKAQDYWHKTNASKHADNLETQIYSIARS